MNVKQRNNNNKNNKAEQKAIKQSECVNMTLVNNVSVKTTFWCQT